MIVYDVHRYFCNSILFFCVYVGFVEAVYVLDLNSSPLLDALTTHPSVTN